MRFKYPRTYHFPFSGTITTDDKVFSNYQSYFDGKLVVVTEKMDGENITVYKDGWHARSIDSKVCAYHSVLQSLIHRWNYQLEETERICGEYLYAQHSIPYNALNSFFEAFSVWRGTQCQDWEKTQNRLKILGIESVPVLWVDKFDECRIKESFDEVVKRGGEGIVVRLFDTFEYKDFATSVAKCVRPNHVQTDKHWKNQKIIPNKVKSICSDGAIGRHTV